MASVDKKRVTLFMDPSAAKHAKAQAILEDITFTSLVERALKQYLPEAAIIRKAVANIEKIPD